MNSPGESKRPLVLLPALLCDERLWAAQVTAFETKPLNVRCSVADLTADDSVAGMAARVLNAAPQRFALAGVSMGGYVAFEILRQAPERVERLALIDTRASPDSDEERKVRHNMINLAQKGRFKGVTPILLPKFIHEDRLNDQVLTEAIMTMAEQMGRDAFVRQQTAIINRPDSRPLLPTIDCPCLILCGRQDQPTPVARHEEMAADIAGSELVVVDDCGHLAPLERPESVTAAMTHWLQREVS